MKTVATRNDGMRQHYFGPIASIPIVAIVVAIVIVVVVVVVAASSTVGSVDAILVCGSIH